VFIILVVVKSRRHWDGILPVILLKAIRKEQKADGGSEYLYLPCSSSEVEKALVGLEVDNISQCDAILVSDYFPKTMIDLITKEKEIAFSMDILDEFAKKFKEMGRQDGAYFEKLMDYIRHRNVEELKALLESMYEFEMFDGIRDAEQYGRYMICDSGHFEYDANLED
jgi:hypothetical protein